MKFSLNFVKEFVDINVGPKELANCLTMAGMEVEAMTQRDDDWTYDIEVTTNRYDWLSMVGIAKEIAAVLDISFKPKTPDQLSKKTPLKRNIIIRDLKDCPYYIGQLLTGVKIGKSGAQAASKINNCGIGVVNDVVDITNYCMLKWGNPLHAFDDDKIQGDIYIRRATKGEQFTGIDGKVYQLADTNLVIADEEKIIALAGVMGAKNTEVDENTKNVFLEAAVFSPVTVRRSRRAAGIDTESSYRFERMVNSLHLEYAAAEAARLIEKEAKGRLQGLRKAGRRIASSPGGVAISVDDLNKYLGSDFPQVKVVKIFKGLGCEVKAVSKGVLKVSGGAHRFDLNREVDFYEEFARIHGYDKIPSKIPFLVNSSKDNLSPKEIRNFYNFKKEIRRHLSVLGFNEIISFSIEAEVDLRACGEKDPIMLVNPLRKQENAMRTTLLLGMLKSVKHNLNRGQSELNLFEVADIYHRSKKGFEEEAVVAIGCTGEANNFFELKGAVENFLTFLNIEEISYCETKNSNFSNALQIKSKDVSLGFLGKLDANAKKHYDLRQNFFYAQMNIAAIDMASSEKMYKPFSAYPPIYRDISLQLKRGIKFKVVEKVIREHARFIVDARVVDVYKQAKTLDDNSMFTLRLYYQSKKRTLTASEVDVFHNTIRDILDKTEGVGLR
jgi:phenylalanyl-tRNA synthetase beta chain